MKRLLTNENSSYIDTRTYVYMLDPHLQGGVSIVVGKKCYRLVDRVGVC